jgi:hypothetical protein
MKVRTKKRLCVAVGLLAFLTMLGVVGGMEWGSITLGRGIALAAACELVGAALLWKGGVLRGL